MWSDQTVKSLDFSVSDVIFFSKMSGWKFCLNFAFTSKVIKKPFGCFVLFLYSKISKNNEPFYFPHAFSVGCSIIFDLPTEVRRSTLECPHLHLWLSLAQWGRMSCCISCDVQKWECTPAFTELNALHWSQYETISQQGMPSLTKHYTNAKLHGIGARLSWEHVEM